MERGAGGSTDGGSVRDGGARRGGERGASGSAADRGSLADLGSKLIVLRTSPETKVTPLALGILPVWAGDAVTAAVLPRPRVRAPGAPKPPIPFTRWKVVKGGSDMAFQMLPDDGVFSSAGPVPVLNGRQELVGLLTMGVAALPDKTKAGNAIGLGAIRAGVMQAGLMAGPPMGMAMGVGPMGPMMPMPGGEGPPMTSTDGGPPMPGSGPPPPGPPDSMLVLAQLVHTVIAPPALFGSSRDRQGPKLPWHTSYEALAAGVRVQQGPDGKWIVDWGQAPDLGFWYTMVQRTAAEQMSRGGDGGREGGPPAQAAPPAEGEARPLSSADMAALAAKKLQPEWTATVASVADPAAGPDAACQLNLPPLPEPLRMAFKIEPADAPNWAAVKPGDMIRFSGRFDANEPVEFPTINVFMTLKAVGARQAPPMGGSRRR